MAKRDYTSQTENGSATPKQEVQLALINERLDQMGKNLSDVKTDVRSVKDEISTHFATKEELGYLKEKLSFHDKILYGFISMIVLAVIGALLRLVVVGGS